MGAVVNMAPDLWQGVQAAVPFVDVVTTMLDASIPLTAGEWDEWGDPREKEFYDYMLAYSPYDQVKAQAYPNMLVTTGLHDSQVQYWEPAKWVAKLRAVKTGDNRLLLKFQDGSFKDPFIDKYVSDGTIKMFAYLVLLYDPSPHPLLCIEDPENQLYPTLLLELAEEFRSYAQRGGQVFVSTHSPDFLNAAERDEVFWLVKENGYTKVKRATDDEQIVAYMNDGDKMGYLWKQGFFEGADPK